MLSQTEKVLTSLTVQNLFQNSTSGPTFLAQDLSGTFKKLPGKLKYKKTGALALSFLSTGKNTQNLPRNLVNLPIENFKGNRNSRKMNIGVALERITDTSPKILNNLNKLISLEYSLDNFHRSNQDTCLVHKPAVFEGQWVQSGDLLADCSASVGGELALGQNILIAYMPWEGYNFEDAILVSERLVYDDLYTSVHIERYEVELRETKLGFEEITREIPDVDQASLKNLNVSGIAKLGSWVEEGDILVGKVTPINKKSQSNYQKLLYTILDKTVLPIRDSSLRAPKGIKAKVIGIQIFKTSKNLMSFKNIPNRQNLSRPKSFEGGSERSSSSPTNFKPGAKADFVSKDFFGKAFSPEKKENLAPEKKEKFPLLQKSSGRIKEPKKYPLSSLYKESLSQKSSLKKSDQSDTNGAFLSSRIQSIKTESSLLGGPFYTNQNLTQGSENSEKFITKLYQQQAEVYNQNNIFFPYKDHFRIFSYSLSKKKKVSENFFNFYPDGKRKFSLEAFQKNKFGLSFEITHNKIISSGFTKNIRNINDFKKVSEKRMSNLSENLNFLKNFFTNYRNRSSFLKNKPLGAARFKRDLLQRGENPLGEISGEDFPLWGKKRQSRFDMKHLRSIFSSAERKYIDFASSSSGPNSVQKTKDNPNIFSKKGPNLSEGFPSISNFSHPDKKSTLSLKINKNNFSKILKYSQEIEKFKENPKEFQKKLDSLEIKNLEGGDQSSPSKPFSSFFSPKKEGLLKTSYSNNYDKNTLKGISSVQVYLAEKRRIQVGDKMAGRHGNKGIISQILPIEDMPFLPDGKPLDMVLNPLGVPSRMNVGQIYECLLGLAGKHLGENFKVFPFDEIYGAEASRSFVYSKLYSARTKTGKKWLFNQNSPGKIRLYDGRTGETFDQAITVGYAYMLRLVHMVDDKIHARSTGPYSLVTQQPLRGRSKQGGQRLGEMEVWALEGYGAAFTLLEMLTIKSDDMTGRMTLWSNLILNKEISIGTPESFKVLICELQALCLDIGLFKVNSKKI
jgi:DNA-directed RNA polymerase subunit beta